jgi:hypothetical protein
MAKETYEEAAMMRETRVRLGDGLSVEFNGLLFRLVCHRENGIDEIVMDFNEVTKFVAFVEMVARATLVAEHGHTQASVSPEARDDLIAYEAARNAAKAKSHD